MADIKVLVNASRNPTEQVVISGSILPHDVICKRGLGRAQRPDVKVVHFLNTGKLAQISLDLPQIDADRHRIQRQAH